MSEASPEPVLSFAVPLRVTLSFVLAADAVIFTSGAVLSPIIVPAPDVFWFPALSDAVAVIVYVLPVATSVNLSAEIVAVQFPSVKLVIV